jgi:hypothetical protein
LLQPLEGRGQRDCSGVNDIVDLAIVVEGKCHRVFLMTSFGHCLDEFRSKLSDASVIKPGVMPEFQHGSIAKDRYHRCTEEGLGDTVFLDRRESLGSRAIHLLEPKPYQAQCPTKQLEVYDAEPTQLSRSLHIALGYYTFAIMDHVYADPVETFHNLLYGSMHPGGGGGGRPRLMDTYTCIAEIVLLIRVNPQLQCMT